jgi:hypothetical protein
MTADSRAWRFPAVQSGRSGAERRASTDRRQSRDRRGRDQDELVMVDLRIGFDRRTLRERRSMSDQRRRGQPVWSSGTAR